LSKIHKNIYLIMPLLDVASRGGFWDSWYLDHFHSWVVEVGSSEATPHVQITLLRADSHYGRPSREVVGLSGQTLLRVQRNGLKTLQHITVYMTGHMTSLSLQNTQILFDFLVVSG
jgi:hypothetical protein